MNKLFEPLQIRSVTFKNRICVSPMCQYSAVDGYANEWHLVHLGSRAVGGASLVMAEATAINPDGRITLQDLGIYEDGHVDFLSKITDFIKSQHSVPGIQLAHAGRKASHRRPWEGGAELTPGEGAWKTVAPSPVAYKNGETIPAELSIEQIQLLVSEFSKAAARALTAGFEVLEIHAAHGYLIHEFLSPLSNKRTDLYGGSFENRCRFLVQILKAVRAIWPDRLPLFVRISATDWVEGGWTIEDSIQLAILLKSLEVDLVDCSSGGNSPGQKIPVAPLYQTAFAEQVRKQAGILTAAVGLITTAGEASKIIESGQSDLVFMARQLLRDPYFPLHAARELGVDQSWPVQYERAKI